MISNKPVAKNQEVWLRARPQGTVTPELFELRDAARPEPGPGELLIRIIYLSLDPAMRGWISDAPNYREPVPLDSVMIGFTLGEVAQSRHPDYAMGDIVYGRQGWRAWALSDGSDIDRKVEPLQGPISAAMHVLGLTGLTAYLGLTRVGQPKAGETVLVSTAAGAVGSMVGQIAKIQGCRTVGLTGSDDKVVACVEDFGYDAAINYKTAGDLEAALSEACPDGIDVYFDNVGGEISDAALDLINHRARIVVCGTMGIPAGPNPRGPRVSRQLLVKRARMEGFLVLDHLHRLDEVVAILAPWMAEGRLRFREDIVEGLAAAPAALQQLLAGNNRGKMMVRVGPDPTA